MTFSLSSAFGSAARTRLAAVAALLLSAAGPAGAQSAACADPGAQCGGLLDTGCLSILGAGSLSAAADDDVCRGQMAEYRRCLSNLTVRCGAGAQSGGETSGSGGCDPADARTEWAALRSSTSIAEIEAFAAFCGDTLQGELAKARLETLKAARVAPAPPPEPQGASSDGFIFPESDRFEVDRRALAGLSRSELRIARNEVYARRGRFFKSADLKRHFGQFDWYQPTSWDPPLNAVERRNVALIQAEEKRR